MKIYYDFQILRVQKYGGISRYFKDIFGIKEGTNTYKKYRLECMY